MLNDIWAGQPPAGQLTKPELSMSRSCCKWPCLSVVRLVQKLGETRCLPYIDTLSRCICIQWLSLFRQHPAMLQVRPGPPTTARLCDGCCCNSKTSMATQDFLHDTHDDRCLAEGSTHIHTRAHPKPPSLLHPRGQNAMRSLHRKLKRAKYSKAA